MKWSMIVGALVLSVSLCGTQRSYGFELLDRMLPAGAKRSRLAVARSLAAATRAACLTRCSPATSAATRAAAATTVAKPRPPAVARLRLLPPVGALLRLLPPADALPLPLAV